MHIRPFNDEKREGFILDQTDAIRKMQHLHIEGKKQRRDDDRCTEKEKGAIVGVCGEAQCFGVNLICNGAVQGCGNPGTGSFGRGVVTARDE